MLAARRWACSGPSPRISRLGRLPPCRALPSLHPQVAHCRPRAFSDSSSDSGDKRRDLYLEQRRKLDSNLGNLGWLTGWFRKMKMRMVLVYILDQNPTFDIVRPLTPPTHHHLRPQRACVLQDELLEGGELVFHALNGAMYCGEEVTAATFEGMAHPRIASILSGVMDEYRAEGIEMFTTSAEPTGYALHSVKLSNLAVCDMSESVEADGQGGGEAEAGVVAAELPASALLHAAQKGQNVRRSLEEKGEVPTSFDEWVTVSLEYKATETFGMVQHGETVPNSDTPRERTMVYVLRGRLAPPERAAEAGGGQLMEGMDDFGWHVFDLQL